MASSAFTIEPVAQDSFWSPTASLCMPRVLKGMLDIQIRKHLPDPALNLNTPKFICYLLCLPMYFCLVHGSVCLGFCLLMPPAPVSSGCRGGVFPLPSSLAQVNPLFTVFIHSQDVWRALMTLTPILPTFKLNSLRMGLQVLMNDLFIHKFDISSSQLSWSATSLQLSPFHQASGTDHTIQVPACYTSEPIWVN